ncbi:MAG: cache domain-containing protein, partial [Candidatus Omnitrophota bacterium]
MKKINSLKVLKKNRYLIACIFTLVMIICGGLLIGKNLHEFSHIEVKNTAKITATVVADYIKNGLAETNQIAEELGNSRHIINILGPESYKYLNDANETLDRYSLRESLACYVINLEGLTIASSNRNSSKSFVNKNYGFRPYFKEAVKGKKASYFALEVTSGERGYYSSVPVKDSTGKVIGAAVVKKTLDIDEQYLKKFEEYFFVNEDGIIFLSSDPKYLFQSFYPL